MATISNTPRPGYAWDATDNCWYPIGTGPHTHADYITSGSAINPTIVDAKGDIIAATAADTVARLAVGANDTVLTADSSTATGLKWATPAAGGMSLLSTTTLSGTSTTISSISGSYNNLIIFIRGVTWNANAILRIRPNNVAASMQGFYLDNTGVDEMRAYNGGSPTYAGNALSNYVLQIFDYTNTTSHKPCSFIGNVSNTNNLTNIFGTIDTTSAITSLVIQTVAGTSTFSTGTVLIYGVK